MNLLSGCGVFKIVSGRTCRREHPVEMSAGLWPVIVSHLASVKTNRNQVN